MIAPIPPVGSTTPSLGVNPSDFQMPGIEDVTGPAKAADPGQGFGAMLEKAIGNLTQLQNDATQQSQALATGQAQNIDQVVMAVEKASLSLELASQVRNKAVEAYQDIFRMQV
jgi:flagellar hook-basal body complex protein FliE